MPTDTHTNIAIARTFSSRLPLPYSSCITNDNIAFYPNSIFTKTISDNKLQYTQNLCFFFCYMRTLAEECGCHDSSIKNIGKLTFDKPACTKFADFTCMLITYRTFYADQVTANCSSECPFECEKQKLDVSMSFAAFPADYFNYVMLFNNSNLASKFGLTPNQTLNHLSKHQWSSLPDLTQIKKVLSKKTLKLNVYYDDLSYTSIEEQEKMNLIDMVANVGGTLGLFLGVSFLSFMVRKFFLEFLIFYLQFIITRYKIIF